MNRPLDRGNGIDAHRYQTWLARFAVYRTPVTQELIELWLKQYLSTDRDLAARVLDSVLFLNHTHISQCFRQLLEGLEGWHKSESKRKGRWYFVPFSRSVGESGDTMLHQLRMATGMTKRAFDPLCVNRSELVAVKPFADDTVVLVDDFSGSGMQASDSWNDIFSELLFGGPRVVLMLVAATSTALKRISEETEMEPVCGTTLHGRDDLFSTGCKHFTDAEKATLLEYCKRAGPSNPKGFGECGLVVVLAHRCPNNSIPVLHANHKKWRGLFPRND